MRNILKFAETTAEAVSLPDGKRRQALIGELKEKREPLRRAIIMGESKIEELKKMLEEELYEIS